VRTLVQSDDGLDQNKRDRLYKYGEIVLKAKLDGRAKGLLWFYAYVFNWTENRRSWWSEESICAHTSMAPSTFQEKKQYLQALGWIDCVKTGLKDPVLVKPTVGRDDPEFEKMCWAKWHPSNKSELTLKELSALSDEELHSISELNGFGGQDVFEEKRVTSPQNVDPQTPISDIW